MRQRLRLSPGFKTPDTAPTPGDTINGFLTLFEMHHANDSFITQSERLKIVAGTATQDGLYLASYFGGYADVLLTNDLSAFFDGFVDVVMYVGLDPLAEPNTWDIRVYMGPACGELVQVGATMVAEGRESDSLLYCAVNNCEFFPAGLSAPQSFWVAGWQSKIADLAANPFGVTL
jgi:hypothetical protein